MENKFRYKEQKDRKKILLLGDDIRLHSGVGTVSREIVIQTAHHFNWLTIGAAINHPDQGKRFDISGDVNEQAKIKDSWVHVLCNNGYGDPDLIRTIIREEKPDALFIITDPRYYTWLFQIENEVRKTTPIVYLNIWDDLPAPNYNRAFYESCDALLAISKQTKFINEIVLGEKADGKVIRYVPHGLNPEIYKPVEETPDFLNFKSQVVGDKEFVVFFNSRNIRRKSIPDLIFAYRLFIESLSVEERKKCTLLLHTQPVDENGTDLPKVVETLNNIEGFDVRFSHQKLSAEQLNWLYNLADVTCLLTSNEGWGLTLTESMLAGTMILANVTGGMQDQMRFTDEKGNWFTPSKDVPSNHKGTYIKHGKWAAPVFPSNRSIQGSPPTPYIWDDRCAPEDAAKKLEEIHWMSKEERKENGLAGREWCLSEEAGFNTFAQAQRVIEGIDDLLESWTPREAFEFFKVDGLPDNSTKHKLVY
jgi:hypothetical protein